MNIERRDFTNFSKSLPWFYGFSYSLKHEQTTGKDWTCSIGGTFTRGQTDRQTDRHTHTLVSVICFPCTGGGLIIQINITHNIAQTHATTAIPNSYLCWCFQHSNASTLVWSENKINYIISSLQKSICHSQSQSQLITIKHSKQRARKKTVFCGEC